MLWVAVCLCIFLPSILYALNVLIHPFYSKPFFIPFLSVLNELVVCIASLSLLHDSPLVVLVVCWYIFVFFSSSMLILIDLFFFISVVVNLYVSLSVFLDLRFWLSTCSFTCCLPVRLFFFLSSLTSITWLILCSFCLHLCLFSFFPIWSYYFDWSLHISFSEVNTFNLRRHPYLLSTTQVQSITSPLLFMDVNWHEIRNHWGTSIRCHAYVCLLNIF